MPIDVDSDRTAYSCGVIACVCWQLLDFCCTESIEAEEPTLILGLARGTRLFYDDGQLGLGFLRLCALDGL